MSAATAAEQMGVGAGDYPVRVSFDPEQRINRLWGIPFLGMAVRWLVLIPHFFVVWVLSVGVGLSILVSWVPVLVLGRQPLAGFYAGSYRYIARVIAWGLFLAGPYPPFSWNAAYPVNVDAPTEGSINRLWGIPFLGLWLRGLLVIPHLIVAFALGVVMYFGFFVIWIPILINGRMPRLGYQIYGGYLRVYTRAYLWLLLAPYPYPPILP
jgi:hypothetical protein